MSERAAFLTAILEQPHEDTHRLVFADWLQEQGNENDRQRAEFIRLQIDISKWEDKITSDIRRRAENILQRLSKGAPVKLTAKTPATMLVREHLLLHSPKMVATESNWMKWFMDDLVFTHQFGPNYRRGFVSSLDCLTPESLTVRRDQLCSIFARHPIDNLVILELRAEIEPPGEGYQWQAYYYHGRDEDYCSMNGWETRAEMVGGVLDDLERLQAEFA